MWSTHNCGFHLICSFVLLWIKNVSKCHYKRISFYTTAFCVLMSWISTLHLAFITVHHQHIWAPQPGRWKVDEACLLSGDQARCSNLTSGNIKSQKMFVWVFGWALEALLCSCWAWMWLQKPWGNIHRQISLAKETNIIPQAAIHS